MGHPSSSSSDETVDLPLPIPPVSPKMYILRIPKPLFVYSSRKLLVQKEGENAEFGFLHISAGYGACNSVVICYGLACKFSGEVAASVCKLALWCALNKITAAHYVTQLIAVDELKNDYRNPVDFCQGLNRVCVIQPYFFCWNSSNSFFFFYSWFFPSMVFTLQ